MRRVVRNPSRNTPGVDGVLWRTQVRNSSPLGHYNGGAIARSRYKDLYFQKKRKLRPWQSHYGDRAQQGLHLLALEPVAETLADPNAYGFRPKRFNGRCHRARLQRAGTKASARWILEGDIKSCFDRISHSWLSQHIRWTAYPGEWLAAGYMEKASSSTEAGTPQGGIASVLRTWHSMVSKQSPNGGRGIRKSMS